MSLESLNGIEYIGTHIKFKVQGFREKSDGFMYYRISVTFTLEEQHKKEEFDYTYEQCLELQKLLSMKCPDLPVLQSPGIFAFKPTLSEVEKRRIEIEKWLSAIVWRCDVLSCADFKKFMNFHKLIEHKWLMPQTPSIILNQGHNFAVQDFFYEAETQVLYVLTTDNSLTSKMDFMTGLFGKAKTNIGSQLFCYRLDVDHQGDPLVKQLWMQQYNNRGTLLTWDEKLTILAIGFESGLVICLKVATQKSYCEHSEFCQIQKHTQAVTGIAMNHMTGYIYSIGKDRSLISTDLANPSNLLRDKDFPSTLTCMTTHQFKLFIGDSIGSIYVFNYENGPLEPMHQIKADIRMNITSLQFCTQKKYLICSSSEGYLSVFEINRQGRENLISQQQLPPNTTLQFSLSTKEIYFNHYNSVVIMDSLRMKYLYSLQAHDDSITKIQLKEDIGLLITSSRDHSVKFWQYKYFPHSIINNQIIPFRKEPVNITIERVSQPIDKQTTQELQQFKPELEDLDHWN